MGVMLLADWRLDMTYPSAFNHIAVNPLSLIVFISALGGLWTFIVRFVQARGDIQALDTADPLSQPSLKTDEDAAD